MHWKNINNTITKTYVFSGFEQAMQFMQEASSIIIALDHHPKWTNTYNKIEIVLSTHDIGNKVGPKDYELADKLDYLFTLSNKENK